MTWIPFELFGIETDPATLPESVKTMAQEVARFVEDAMVLPSGFILHWQGFATKRSGEPTLLLCVDIYRQEVWRIPRQIGSTAYVAAVIGPHIRLLDEGLVLERRFGEVISAVVARIEKVIERHRASVEGILPNSRNPV